MSPGKHWKVPVLALLLVVAPGAPPGGFPVSAQEPQAVFRADVRLVEVYATVLDHRGRFLEGLGRDRFEVRDNGALQRLAAFEPNQANLSCAILLDTTGSMARALPAVKNGIARLIDEFRDDDTVAVYSFAGSLRLLQDFTRDKAAAKRAVMATRASGATALFDSLAQLARELARRSGKKAIVAFTDGQDNVSLLNAGAAITRAKKVGVPVYAVAQGEALRSAALVKELADLARQTGGRSYQVRDTGDIADVFRDISNELRNTYMLAYKAPAAEGRQWRTIQVSVNGLKDYKVRAREGYLPE